MLDLYTHMGTITGMKKSRKCIICKIDFEYYERVGYKNIVCSRACNGQHQKNIGNRPPAYRGDKHPSWKGGRSIHLVHGRTPYWRINVDGKRVYEHRYVMERKLGRKLSPHEIVHHIDHDSTNNNPSNLQLMTWSEHTLHHHVGARYKK